MITIGNAVFEEATEGNRGNNCDVATSVLALKTAPPGCVSDVWGTRALRAARVSIFPSRSQGKLQPLPAARWWGSAAEEDRARFSHAGVNRRAIAFLFGLGFSSYASPKHNGKLTLPSKDGFHQSPVRTHGSSRAS